MKKVILPALMLIGLQSFEAHSQTMPRRSYSYSQTAVSVYCTEARFKSYADLATSMRDFVTPEEYSKIYLPLRTKASKAQITLRNYGPLSSKTHDSLWEIVNFVNQNENQFNALWEVEAFMPVALDLFDMTEALNRDLQ